MSIEVQIASIGQAATRSSSAAQSREHATSTSRFDRANAARANCSFEVADISSDR